MVKKVLFIIDAQRDFMDGGRLGVDNSKDKMDALAKYIRESKGKYDSILASVDWHPSTHCSFKPNGGMWPPHCVQFSTGAAIYQPILDAINESIKPLTPKKKETITMLEKMRKENMLNESGKKRRGRPPKVQEEDANVVEEVSDDIEEEPVEEEETINE